jgi:hypothetical protein
LEDSYCFIPHSHCYLALCQCNDGYIPTYENTQCSSKCFFLSHYSLFDLLWFYSTHVKTTFFNTCSIGCKYDLIHSLVIGGNIHFLNLNSIYMFLLGSFLVRNNLINLTAYSVDPDQMTWMCLLIWIYTVHHRITAISHGVKD